MADSLTRWIVAEFFHVFFFNFVWRAKWTIITADILLWRIRLNMACSQPLHLIGCLIVCLLVYWKVVGILACGTDHWTYKWGYISSQALIFLDVEIGNFSWHFTKISHSVIESWRIGLLLFYCIFHVKLVFFYKIWRQMFFSERKHSSHKS